MGTYNWILSEVSWERRRRKITLEWFTSQGKKPWYSQSERVCFDTTTPPANITGFRRNKKKRRGQTEVVPLPGKLVYQLYVWY